MIPLGIDVGDEGRGTGRALAWGDRVDVLANQVQGERAVDLEEIDDRCPRGDVFALAPVRLQVPAGSRDLGRDFFDGSAPEEVVVIATGQVETPVRIRHRVGRPLVFVQHESLAGLDEPWQSSWDRATDMPVLFDRRRGVAVALRAEDVRGGVVVDEPEEEDF